MPERYYDVEQLQEVLGLSERTIFRLLKKGELTGFKSGRKWRFTQSDVDSFIARQRQKVMELRREATPPREDLLMQDDDKLVA